ncbi:LysR family transcriptional regulator (plasmid) [Cedecea neteri]|uniref:LysR substrate-binding domain-containing protein n=1 Tax=Cedecea neteri TaxID=158822 RepID=UPI002893479B|nr:LysR family transcriptional regulator [Cedecea neteri]WNJ82186.1 LysR family transcriptional regulator [Cedecea neteri]
MRSDMLELMNVFVHVVESDSFTKAAEALQLHRPAVSKALQQLEKTLGVKLLHRTTRSMSLTVEGRDIYQRAKFLLADVNEMISSFSPGQSPQGRLRVEVPLVLAHIILIPCLGEFQALYPEIELVLTASDRKTNMVAEGIDCVVRLGELDDSSLVSRRIGHLRMATCASPSYLEKYGIPTTPDDLMGHKGINFFSRHSREVMEWIFMLEDAAVCRTPNSSVLVNNSDVLLSCGLEGLGLLHAPYIVLEPHIRTGELCEVLEDYANVTKPVSIIYPDRRYLLPKVRVFMDWFYEIFTRYDLR